MTTSKITTNILSSLKETVALQKYAKIMSIHMTSMHEWITTIIIITIMMQPIKTAPITKKTENL